MEEFFPKPTQQEKLHDAFHPYALSGTDVNGANWQPANVMLTEGGK